MDIISLRASWQNQMRDPLLTLGGWMGCWEKFWKLSPVVKGWLLSPNRRGVTRLSNNTIRTQQEWVSHRNSTTQLSTTNSKLQRCLLVQPRNALGLEQIWPKSRDNLAIFDISSKTAIRESDIFWNAKDILLVNYVEKSHTITEANHTCLLRQMQKKIQNIQHEEKKLSRTTF